MLNPGDTVRYRDDACRGWLGQVITLSGNGEWAFCRVLIRGAAKEKANVVQIRARALEVTT